LTGWSWLGGPRPLRSCTLRACVVVVVVIFLLTGNVVLADRVTILLICLLIEAGRTHRRPPELLALRSEEFCFGVATERAKKTCVQGDMPDSRVAMAASRPSSGPTNPGLEQKRGMHLNQFAGHLQPRENPERTC
jgi:hypothetical protein